MFQVEWSWIPPLYSSYETGIYHIDYCDYVKLLLTGCQGY
jgi:hypothetical protein